MRLLISSLAFILLFTSQLFAQEADIDNGKKLFNSNCAACHKLEGKLIGPPLKGISEKREQDWLIAWIRDNEALRASGDEDAIAIYEEYNKLPMIAYPQFSDQDIIDILAYTDDKPVEKADTGDSGVVTAASLGIDSLEVVKGKKIFNANCAACHKLEGKLIGPGLANIQDKRTDEWLNAWIKDNAALRASGDADAIAIFEEYNGSPMTAFPQLSDADIDAILLYTKHSSILEGPKDATEVSSVAETAPIPWATYLVLLVLAIAVVWVYFVSKNEFVKLVTTIALLLTVGYFAYWGMMSIGVDQGYKPVQPIAFSHKIHAGDNKIDCQYCHSSAKHSKTSGIPSVNVCMNCHKGISEYNGPVTAEFDKEFYDAEIQKIYDAVGWDKEENQYIAGYEQKPIEWVRIHNLPDFAYFNHSQHVTVGGVACQKCHGPVEEMEELEQFSPLTMGWCINCHRETEVKVEDNEYYAKIHEELSKKYGVEKVTVAQLGGMECGKCHY
ncbi:c-type cytochrome [Aureibaculum conchae]|uniref:c-type cytochrome n=1 Tax=Aureibaculum sp. 2308TA14-22 TaxID=3108392 RepID=UPI00339A235A